VSASACFASASWLDWISNMATAATLNKARITIGEACKWPIGLSRRPSKAAGSIRLPTGVHAARCLLLA